MSAVNRAQRPLLLGHRGARKAALENTLAAFDLALAHGCDGFEFDVRRTADGEGVVCHDPTLAGMKVAEVRYDELVEASLQEAVPRALLRERADLPPEGALPLSLEEVFTRFAGRAYLDVELKVAGLEEPVVRLLREIVPARGYVISSFLPEVLQALRWLDSGVITGLICKTREELEPWRLLPINVLIPHFTLTSTTLISEVHDARKQVFVWTVNEPKEMVRLAEAGADAIISDDTELLAKTLGRRG